MPALAILDHDLPDEVKDDFDDALNWAEISRITSLITYIWLSQQAGQAGKDRFEGIGRFDAVDELKKFTKLLQISEDRSDLKFEFNIMNRT